MPATNVPAALALLLCLIGSGMAAQEWPDLPDPVGRAGMAAGMVGDAGDTSPLIAGGANFPERPPWEGGAKIFHRTIWRLDGRFWRTVGDLPRPNAYAACAGTRHGLVIAGGTDAEAHTARCLLVDRDGGVRDLPALPHALAYAACADDGRRLFVIGGSATPDATTASRCVFSLALDRLDDATTTWREETPLPEPGRILATAVVQGGRLLVVGGCALAADDRGRPRRIYLTDACFLQDDAWRPLPSLPTPRAGAACPMPVVDGNPLLIGGDTGQGNGLPPDRRPANSATVWRLGADAWEGTGLVWPTPIATTPTLIHGNTVITVSGETAPGLRTPRLSSLPLTQRSGFTTWDAAIALIGAIGLLLLAVEVGRHGTGGVRRCADPATAPGRNAWMTVGLLWVVATLNYLDRNIIAAMHDPIVRDVPQSAYQFGLLTGIFLVVYATMSPIGGFLADRYSRRLVILASLIVWSAVTWMTGHVDSFGQMLGARALMGVSEACYIPAALALITDHHRGRTRSLATGIHMSGVYAGATLAGIGGLLAETLGWRMAFTLLGFVGVSYALVLIVFLKDGAAGGPSSATAQDQGPRLSPLAALGSLFGVRAFWLLLVVVGCAGMTNWLLLTWLPKLLQDKFALGMAAAGISATVPATIAKYLAVVLGAIVADAWSARQARARSLLPGIAFLVAGPLIGLCTLADTLWLFLACIAAQGIAQGVLDATLMPVLRSHIDERCAATGYGFLNLVSAGLGAAATIGGGRLLDAGISLDATLACSGAGLLLAGLLLTCMPAPKGT